jgi:hypothetical protein
LAAIELLYNAKSPFLSILCKEHLQFVHHLLSVLGGKLARQCPPSKTWRSEGVYRNNALYLETPYFNIWPMYNSKADPMNSDGICMKIYFFYWLHLQCVNPTRYFKQ